MRVARLLALPALIACLSLAVAACSTGTSPGWTYEPPPSATPVPPPTATPSGQPSVAPSESPAGNVVRIVAHNIAYDVNNIEVTSGQPFTIEFDNQDAGVPHNVTIKDASGTEMFKGEIFNGVDTKTYQVPALSKGDYTFFCSVHANMTGTLSAP